MKDNNNEKDRISLLLKHNPRFESFANKNIKSTRNFEDKAYLDSLDKKRKEIEALRKPYLSSDPYVENNPKQNFGLKFLKNKEIDFNQQEMSRQLKQKNSIAEWFKGNCKSVTDFYQYTNPNFNYQSTMEDFLMHVDGYNYKDTDGLFIIFDGYSGYEIADYCLNRFSEAFSTYLTLHERDQLKNNNSTYNTLLMNSPLLARDLLKSQQLQMGNYTSTTQESTVKYDYLNKRPFEFNDIQNILIKTFKKIDFETQLCKNTECGSSGIVAFFTVEKGEILNPEYEWSADNENIKSKYKTVNHRILYLSNIGNCRGVIVSTIQSRRVSYEHVVTDKDEFDRVINSGGLVIDNKLAGKTILSRAIGDHKIKNFGLLSTPSVNKIKLTPLDKWLIIGSSGVWSVLRDDDLYRMSHNMNTTEQFGNGIRSMILNRGCQENMSFYIIGLKSDYYY